LGASGLCFGSMGTGFKCNWRPATRLLLNPSTTAAAAVAAAAAAGCW